MSDRSTLELMKKKLEEAKRPEDVFGNSKDDIKNNYRTMMRSAHPDLAIEKDKALASQVASLLVDWKMKAENRVFRGIYGSVVIDKEPKKPLYTEIELTVKKKVLKLTGLLGKGIFSNVHSAEYDNDKDHNIFVKISRSPKDNDMLDREYKVLQEIWKPDPITTREDVFAKHRNYTPYPVAGFTVLDDKRVKHKSSIFTTPVGECHTVKDLREFYFPNGMHSKDVYWMIRRILLALWMAHLRGYIHGGITPDHVLVFPEPQHGIVLLDWTCSAKIGEENIPAFNPEYKDFYPPELFSKGKAREHMDIYMVGKLAKFMLGDNWNSIPAPMQRLFEECCHPQMIQRPQDAEVLHNRIGAIIDSTTGRKFEPFVLPK